MLLGLLRAGKTHLLANIMPDGSAEQELAFGRVTHGRPAPHPVGFNVEQNYTLHDAPRSLVLIDTPGIEPGSDAHRLQPNLRERMFPEDAAASVDQVWLCVSVDTPKALNADKVQALLLQLEQAGLTTVVVLTKADRLFFQEECTKSSAMECNYIEDIMRCLRARLSVIKAHVYISTFRSPRYVSRTDFGQLRFPAGLNELKLTTMGLLERSKLAAFARFTAVTLDVKMAASAKAILHGIRWRLVFVVCQPIPILPELLGVPYLLQKTFSRVFAVWGMDDACQKIVSDQLLTSNLGWKMAWWGLLKAVACTLSFGVGSIATGAAARVAAVTAIGAGAQGMDFCSLVHDTIHLGLIQTGVLVQLSMLTGGHNWVLADDPKAQTNVEVAIAAYKAICHARVKGFCDNIRNKYMVFTNAQLQELEQQLHQFLRELVQDCVRA